jgi:GNAT superfamily N-acetyltransferase
MTSLYSIARFGPDCRADFDRLHSEENGHGWCRCVAWWVPTWERWGERSAEENRALREALCARGEHDGYLLYAGGEPAAWAQAGPRDRLPKLVAQMQLAPDPGAWAVTCVLTAPRFRRRGLLRRLLAEVIVDVRARGAERIEAFPKHGEALEEGDLWNGPVALWEELGFARVAQVGPRLHMRLQGK